MLGFVKKPSKRQHGVSLMIALMMLLVISIISITAISVATLDEKMTSNLADKEISFQAAESGLMLAEKWIEQLAAQPPVMSTCSEYPCIRHLDSTMDFARQTAAWWNQNAGSYNTTTLFHTHQPPRYYIEHYRFVADNPTIGNGVSSGYSYYRVTTRGVAGANNQAQTILQTSVARRY